MQPMWSCHLEEVARVSWWPLAVRPPLSIGIHPDRRRRRANPPQRNWRSVGLEGELIMLAASIRGRARNGGDLAAGEISDLAAYAVGSLDRRHGQAIYLRPILGVELHPIDRQHVQVFLAAVTIFARERNDVTLVGGIVERNREARPSLLAVKEGDDLARETVAGDPERFAVPGHQGIEIDVWPFALGYRRRLDEAWCC